MGPQLGVKPAQHMIYAFVSLLLIRVCRHGASIRGLPQLLLELLIPFRMRLREVEYPAGIARDSVAWIRFSILGKTPQVGSYVNRWLRK